ncbi:thymidine kinase [Bacteroidia bacterium]|nr:thymidine kinase [Bacteroidia bacterium]
MQETIPPRGCIEVICGSMFSGKTEELIRRIRRATFAKQKVELFKPRIDRRYHETEIVSHDGSKIISKPVPTASDILPLVSKEVNVIGIDEAQFFGDDLVTVCNQLADGGYRVIVAGLDMDFMGKPFGPMPNLLAVAEFITKVHAICVECGEPAQNSFRTVQDKELVVLGETDAYKPLCRKCYNTESAK